jgi:MFS family permease
MVTYLDRASFNPAASIIYQVLGLQNVGQLRAAITAFSISYSLFEIPSGWLGDVYGPRRTLIRIVLWWSVFTVLTATVGLTFSIGTSSIFVGLGALVAIRFLFGAGEAGAYPNITRALHNWFPFKQRGFAQGAVWTAGRLMGGLTPIIWWAIVNEDDSEPSWRMAFCLFGAVGFIWCIAFALWFRNRPEEHPSVNEAERDLIHDVQTPQLEPFDGARPMTAAATNRAPSRATENAQARVPWLGLAKDTNLWALCLMYFFASYGWYFNITYLSDYLKTQRHVDSQLRAIYSGGPLLMGAITCVLGGFLCDRLVRRTGNVTWGRRVFGIIGHGLCGLCWFASIFTPTALTFALAVSFAAFWNDLTMGSAWATCQDIGKRNAAIVAGCMNTIGNLGGAAAGWITGKIIDSQGPETGYPACFFVFGCVYLLAMLLWFKIDANRPVAGQAVTS